MDQSFATLVRGALLIAESVGKPVIVDSITKSIDASLSDKEASRYSSRRFGASGSLCARWKAFERLEDFVPKMMPNEPTTLRLFGAGNAAHAEFQNSLLAHTGKLYGNWACTSCGSVMTNQTMPERPCPNSKAVKDFFNDSVEFKLCSESLGRHQPAWEYKEYYMREDPLNHPDYQIGMFSDGIWLTDTGWRILELKSIDNNLFEAQYTTKHPDNDNWRILKSSHSRLPFTSHVDQAQMYAWVLSQKAADYGLDPLKFEGITILYLNRETFADKAFDLDYDPAVMETRIQLIQTCKDAVDAGDAMLAPAKCSDRNHYLAKQCPRRLTCFPYKVRKKKKEKDGLQEE